MEAEKAAMGLKGLSFLMLLAAAATGAAQGYSFQLQARTAAGTYPPYQLPATASITGASPQLNDVSRVVFRVLDEPEGVWLGGSGAGSIVYQAQDSDRLLSDASLNNDGRIVWEEFSGASSFGIYSYRSGVSGPYLNGPAGNTEWASPKINDVGQVAFRGSSSGIRSFLSWDDDTNSYFSHERQSGNIAFLFTPFFNNNRQIAAKVMLTTGPGNDPNEIRLYDFLSYTTIAQDDGADTGSIYGAFYNSVGVNDMGQVAFISTYTTGGRGVFLGDGTNTIEIVNSNTSEVATSIESFAPSVTNGGLVVFRAFGDDGRRAIWAGNGVFLRRVISEGDMVMTDLGPAVIGWPGSPAFSGAPAVNEVGEIVFAAGLVNPADPDDRIGTGVFVARPLGDVPFTQMSVQFGSITGGTLDSLRQSDDSYLEIASQAGINPARFLTVRATFSAFLSLPSRFALTLESRSSLVNTRQEVKIFHWNTTSYVVLEDAPLPLTDTVRRFENISSSFVHPTTGEVRVQIEHYAGASAFGVHRWRADHMAVTPAP